MRKEGGGVFLRVCVCIGRRDGVGAGGKTRGLPNCPVQHPLSLWIGRCLLLTSCERVLHAPSVCVSVTKVD